MNKKIEIDQYYRAGNGKTFETAFQLCLDEEEDIQESELDTIYEYSRARLLDGSDGFMVVMFDALAIAYLLGYQKGGAASQGGNFKKPFRVPF